jgi:hypothetical protein
MNAIVVYESIYGNTRATAEAIAEGLGGVPVVSPAELPAHVADQTCGSLRMPGRPGRRTLASP